MMYHRQTTLPLADVMNASVDEVAWDISYQFTNSQLIISNTASTLIGTLKIDIAYDPRTVKLLTKQIISSYEYSFDSSREGMITIFVDGTLTPGQLISIPLQWDTSLSISSPVLITNDSSSSLSITRVE